MALEVISGSPTKYTGSLNPGEKITGYLKQVLVEDNKYGNKSCNLLMMDENGSEFKCLTDGTAAHTARNMAAFAGLVPKDPNHVAEEKRDGIFLGHYIEITRVGEYVNKAKKTLKTYQFACDKERPIPANVAVNQAVGCDTIPF